MKNLKGHTLLLDPAGKECFVKNENVADRLKNCWKKPDTNDSTANETASDAESDSTK